MAAAGTPFGQPRTFEPWPSVPIAAFGGRDDRFFPIEFQRSLVRSRLGLSLRELPGGHLNALSEPAAVAEALLQF